MESLNDFIATSRDRLRLILERLQLSADDVCSKLQHTNTPREEKVDDEPPLPPSLDTPHQVTLTVENLRLLLNDAAAEHPKRFSDLQVNFTREQKLQLYEHVTQCTGKCTEPEPQMPLLYGQLSFAEIVALKNQEKKKKRKYRKSKPTQIEEVRGLVELQMQALQQYWHGDEADSQPERKGRSLDESHRSSRSRGRNRSPSGQRESSDHCQGRRHGYSPQRAKDSAWRHYDERPSHRDHSRSSRYTRHVEHSRQRSRSESRRRHHRSPSHTKRRRRSSSASYSSESPDHHRRKKSKSKHKHKKRRSHSRKHRKSHK